MAVAQTLRFFNTRTREVQEFTPLQPGHVSLYACGPTVYNFAHIGNLRAYVFVDTLKRALLWRGFQVKHVMNITDVGHLTDDADQGDDKMEKAARELGRDIWDLARYYTEAFFEHTGDLGILPPDVVCRATDHIQEQIDLVKRIEENGAAYIVDDGVYLDTSKVPGYADFARLNLEGQQEGHRVEQVEGKRNATDFALWKFAKGARRQMEWESPWGRGFPGWHAECTAMSTHYLGERYDIHTGGIDHIPVHHTNEIAQMRAATQCAEWVEFWMHNNFLVLDKGDGDDSAKMAKSSGEFLTLSVLRRWGLQPLAYRYFLLGAHYRKELKFSRDNVEAAAGTLGRLWKATKEIREAAGGATGKIGADSLTKYRDDIEAAICDDLNTPRALAVVWGVVRDEAVAPEDKVAFLDDADRLLGLRLLDGPCGAGGGSKVDAEKIEGLLEKRREARANKDFAAADTIRDALLAVGIVIKDGKDGTSWELAE